MFFFVFKQKTAYEIQYGLVGSEMCIRDSTAVELLKGMDAIDGEACWAAGQEIADVMVKIPLYGLAVKFGDEGTRNTAGSLMQSMWAQPADPYVRAALIDARALDPRGNIAADLLEPLIQKAGSSVERMHAFNACLLYTSPSPRDRTRSRLPSSA